VRRANNPFATRSQGLSFFTTAPELAVMLGGSGVPNYAGWCSCRCPAHADLHASLSVKEVPRGWLFRCFASCTREEIVDAIETLHRSGQLHRKPAPLRFDTPHVDVDAIVRRIVGECESPRELPPFNEFNWVSRYLSTGRGITGRYPNDLLNHRSLYHKPTMTSGPAMVALVRNLAGDVVAVHRTWIDSKTYGKADISPVKMMLGPVAGHAVHLIGLPSSSPVLYVAEGIETALSYAQLNGLTDYTSVVWAALSSSGLANLLVPDHVTRIVVICDNDDACTKAAKTLAATVSHRASVTLQFPPDGVADFNDLLRGVLA
jgi:hypothetical protein